MTHGGDREYDEHDSTRSADAGYGWTSELHESNGALDAPPPDAVASLLAAEAAAPLGLVITRGADFTVTYANPASRELLGAGRAIATGLPFEEVFVDPDVSRAVILLRRVSRTGRALHEIGVRVGGRSDARSADAGQHAAASRSHRLLRLTVWTVPKGAPTEAGPHLALRVRDATATESRSAEYASLVAGMRELNERLLLAALREQEETERAKAASESMSSFLATMSHELRTPLTAIMGYEELLAEQISGPITEAQAHQLERIRASSQHLLSVINGVLKAARMDAGRETAAVSLVDATELLEEAMELVLPMATNRALSLRLDAPAPAFALETDRDKVRQILVNLTANAVKFTERGEVSLSAYTDDAGFAEFRVLDTGIGIEREYLDRIFDPFWRVEEGHGRRVDGTGLGLSVSQRLAHLLGGDLTVRSTKGEGSEFTLRLPLRTADSNRVR
ncbi:MAG TPA: ATP-binding protein [Gemmatimonadaceae bacterium]|nr:ATP-binding protein [Gemmatimonadaceae bacterium]